jgi:adenosine deaminase
MELANIIQTMPKVELHVHLEGAIQPATLLTLAQRNQITLPATTVEELRAWYSFQDFSRFVEVYLTISDCLRTPDDVELIAREFLAAQAAQNIRYSEVTYTAFTHYYFRGLGFQEQLAALNRARAWASAELGTDMGIILDIPRVIPAEAGLQIADWAISAMDDGVIALGLGGPEAGFPADKFREAFEKAHAAGLPAVPHAGETDGAASIWSVLNDLHAVRIGHGVRCLEDETLVETLRERQIPLEVCPSSNVCLGVAPGLAQHPLPRLMEAGLYLTINSDDPPLFNTTLTDEYLKVAETFGLNSKTIQQFVLNAARATLLPQPARENLEAEIRAWWEHNGRETNDTRFG